MVLLFIVQPVAVPEVVVAVIIPLTYPDVPVPKEERFLMVLLFIVAVVGVDAKLIPATPEPAVVKSRVPPRMLFSVVLPITLFDIFIDVATPDTLIPKIVPDAEVGPDEVKPPNTLFCITIVPGEEQLIPTTAPVLTIVAINKSTPEEAPIVFAVKFPTLTFPAVMLIPHKTPFAEVKVLAVDKLIAVMVFP